MDDTRSRLILSAIELRNFRCFSHKKILFHEQITWISGLNGSGKTSLFEALYYACYLRSFRAAHTREMIQSGHDTFFIKLFITGGEAPFSEHQLQAGFSGKKRIIRIDQRAVSSHRELMDYFRVISVTEDDLELIQDGPQKRRSFLDQTIAMENSGFAKIIKEFKVAVEQKQVLLHQSRVDLEMYAIWTQQIREKTVLIQEARKQILGEMEVRIQQLIALCNEPDLSVSYSYVCRSQDISDEELCQKEMKYRRILYGAHLDDILITFQGKSSRLYASRGQQKLILFLMKIYQIERITKQRGPVLVLVDDFITDFDQERYEKLSFLFKLLNTQIIYTIPNAKLGPISLLQANNLSSHIELPR